MRRVGSASTPAEGTTPEQLAKGTWRTMDCIDCHNVVAHRVAPTPEQAVNAALAAGRIDRGLPFVRREGGTADEASHQTRTRPRAPSTRNCESSTRHAAVPSTRRSRVR